MTSISVKERIATLDKRGRNEKIMPAITRRLPEGESPAAWWLRVGDVSVGISNLQLP
jgi:hypothetical protein